MPLTKHITCACGAVSKVVRTFPPSRTAEGLRVVAWRERLCSEGHKLLTTEIAAADAFALEEDYVAQK